MYIHFLLRIISKIFEIIVILKIQLEGHFFTIIHIKNNFSTELLKK